MVETQHDSCCEAPDKRSRQSPKGLHRTGRSYPANNPAQDGPTGQSEEQATERHSAEQDERDDGTGYRAERGAEDRSQDETKTRRVMLGDKKTDGESGPTRKCSKCRSRAHQPQRHRGVPQTATVSSVKRM